MADQDMSDDNCKQNFSNHMSNKAFNFVTLINSRSNLNEWFSAHSRPPPHNYIQFSDCDSI